jgi:hypothetical protein
MTCLFGHKWDGYKCKHCGKIRLPAMVVFATYTQAAFSMAAFGNTAQYYSPNYCIERVRSNFHLPTDATILYVAREDWSGPVPDTVNGQFKMDLTLTERLQTEYLKNKLGMQPAQISCAIARSQAMQAPQLGLLWLCVPLS